MGWTGQSIAERRRLEREQQARRRAAGLVKPLTREQKDKFNRKHTLWRRKYAAREREKARRRYRTKAEWVALLLRLSIHKITLDQFHAKCESQDFRCAICGHDMDGYRKQHIDHDHVTGKFRGVLCQNCNNGLGHFKDNPARLVSAAHYLERHAAV